MTSYVIAIPQDCWDRWAHHVEPFLEAAVVRGHAISVADIARQHREGLCQVLVVMNERQTPQAAIALQRGLNNIHIWATGGHDMNEWLDDVLVAIRTLAQEQGADRLTLHGRVGWGKILKKHGWDVTAIEAETRI